MTSYKTVERIHRDVNASVTYRTDLQQYGVPDFWQKAGKYGDCEDYALLKRAKLLEAGCPPDRVNLVTCLVGGTDGHCVLYVETDNAGAWILDNRYSWPMRANELPYKWLEIEKCGQWFAVSGFA